MDKTKYLAIEQFIDSRCKKRSDYKITDKVFFSKTSMSKFFQTRIENLYGKEFIATIHIIGELKEDGFQLGLVFSK